MFTKEELIARFDYLPENFFDNWNKEQPKFRDNGDDIEALFAKEYNSMTSDNSFGFKDSFDFKFEDEIEDLFK